VISSGVLSRLTKIIPSGSLDRSVMQLMGERLALAPPSGEGLYKMGSCPSCGSRDLRIEVGVNVSRTGFVLTTPGDHKVCESTTTEGRTSRAGGGWIGCAAPSFTRVRSVEHWCHCSCHQRFVG
jgi:hypothetical protein